MIRLFFWNTQLILRKPAEKMDISPVAVTAGYVLPEARTEFFQNMDAANVDLKAFSEKFYKKICGGKLESVLETLEYLRHETDVWFEITTLLIPGENDSSEEVHHMSEWIMEHLGADVPLHFTAFHPDWKMRDISHTPHSTLNRARQIALAAGIRYVYVGNVHDKSGSSTYCHQCGELLIGRDWYELSDWNLEQEGNCIKCGTKCPGKIEQHPGNWEQKEFP